MRGSEQLNDRWRLRGAGGTPGGIGSFLLGLALAVGGAYLLMNQVYVGGGYWMWWGQNTFGLTLLPVVLGIGLLFFNGRSVMGWGLTICGLVIIFAGILANVQMYIRPTSLYTFLIILVLISGGLGLIAKSLKGR